jgi:hypothetical protein
VAPLGQPLLHMSHLPPDSSDSHQIYSHTPSFEGFHSMFLILFVPGKKEMPMVSSFTSSCLIHTWHVPLAGSWGRPTPPRDAIALAAAAWCHTGFGGWGVSPRGCFKGIRVGDELTPLFQ